MQTHTHTPRTGKGRRHTRVLLALAAVQCLALQSLIAAEEAPADPSAAAQQEKPKDDTVVVMDTFNVKSGFSGSLAAAAEIKQSLPGITEVIAAEDIGKMPDISIADSLTRLTGLTTQRINGRSQAINIRGMSGDFSTGLLNGREQVTTNSNRAVEFDQYPAELLTGAVVYKTTDASLIGQGLAGTVDLRTVRPLSQSRRTIAVNSFYDWTALKALNAGSKRSGIRYTASYIDQFNKGKIGFAIGFSHSDKPGQGQQWNAWGYPNVGASVDASEPFVLGGAKPFVRSSQLKRDGVMAVIEFKPTDDLHSIIDIYHSKFDETQQLRGIEIPLQWSSAQLQPGFTVQDGLITKGSFGNVFGVMRNDVVYRKDDVWAAGWNLKYTGIDGWTLIGDLSFSKINRTDTVLETYSGTGANQVGTADTMAYSLESGTGAVFTPRIDYTNTDVVKLSSPQGWGGNIVPGGQAGYLKQPKAKDELKQAKLIAKRAFPWFFKNIEMGLSFSDRSKSEKDINPNYLALAGGATSAPLPNVIGITDLSFIGIKGMASYDPIAALNSGIYERIRNPNADVVSVDWDVKERVSLGYAQLGLDKKLGRIPLTGNLGFQLIHTDQSSKGLAASGTGTSVSSVAVSGGAKYWDFVPSLNLNAQIGERRFIRFSASRQLARQKMSDMRAGNNFTYNAGLASSTDPLHGPWSTNGGNPALKPWRSNSLDLSFDQYFKDNMGYVSLAGFYKKLVSYTYNQNTVVDFTGYPYTGTAPAIFEGTNSRPANGQGGYMRGLELTVSLPSEMFSPEIKGFGLIVGGALTQSSIQPDLGNPSTPLPGLSKKVATVTVYYDRHGFSARVSQRYRSEFRANVDTFGPRGENFRTVQAETVIDAQVSYTFQDGMFKGLSLMLQGNNLNDEPLATYQGTDRRLVQDYQRYGRSYSAGVSYKF